MMPKKSGIDVCREIRKTSTVPIIMLTAKGEEIFRQFLKGARPLDLRGERFLFLPTGFLLTRFNTKFTSAYLVLTFYRSVI
jgi:CheY-like chemotaxis protein